MEIERKYLMARLPENLETYSYIDIEQGYISTAPVIRIRKKCTVDSERYVLTIKSSGMLSRQEYELELTGEEYEGLKPKVEGNIISKRRYIIPLREEDLTLELDIFKGAFEGLIMGEIEFPDKKRAEAYVPEDMLGSEVTFDRRFHNSNMSSMSMEDISVFLSGLDNV